MKCDKDVSSSPPFPGEGPGLSFAPASCLKSPVALQLGSLCSQPIFDSPIHDAHNSIPDVHILLRTRGIFSGTAMTRPDGQPKLPEAVSGRPLAYSMPKSREKGSGKRGWGLNLFPYPNSLSTPPVSGSAPRTTKFAEAAMTRAGEACAAIMAKTGKLKPLELAKLNKESGTSQPIAAHRNPSRHIAAHRNPPRHIATHRGTSQPTAAHRGTSQPIAAHRNPSRHIATHRGTSQPIATHRSTNDVPRRGELVGLQSRAGTTRSFGKGSWRVGISPPAQRLLPVG